MNVQAHMSGPAAAAAQNQAAASATSQNGSTLVQQMQNLGAGGGGGGGGVGGVRGFFAADNEMHRARLLMQDKIYTVLSQRHQQQPLDENARKKFEEIVKKLEEGLFRTAHSKEDYMNFETLESRLHQLIKRSTVNPRTQHPRLVNSSSPVGTMIPTPGMSHSGNSTMIVASSVDASMIVASAPTTVNPGSLLPSGGIHGGSFNRSDGSLSNGYQQSPANFSLSSGGNLSSMGAQTITSQMIPAAAAAAQNQAAASATSQNGSMLVQQMQNLGVGGGGGGGGVGGVRGFFAADNDMPSARLLMQDKIYTVLLQRHQQQPLDENARKKLKDIVKKLEEGLFRSDHSKEDYMNFETLESRLHQLIKRSTVNPRTQHPQLVNSSSPVGTMIPTPGMSHSGNSTMIVASSVDASMIAASAPTTVNPGSLLPSGGIHGSLSNGYQQSPANFSLSSGGNLSSMGAQTITSQMIPAAAAAAQNQAAASATSQNGSMLVQQMQNLGVGGGGGGGGGGVGGVRGFFAADNDMPSARLLMQDKIYTVLLPRHQQQPLDENARKKLEDIVKRLEEGLFRSAHSKVFVAPKTKCLLLLVAIWGRFFVVVVVLLILAWVCKNDFAGGV